MGSEKLLLGIDGGGTKTTARLARLDGSGPLSTLGEGKAGSSNLRAVGYEKAIANLDAAIDSAWAGAGRSATQVDSAVLAVSGAGRADVQQLLTDWATRRELAKRLLLVHDAEAVLAAGTPNGHGVALVAGTGSVAFGRDPQGSTAIAGGWGYWFGDEGSAFSLGQQGLRAVSQAADGRGKSTCLTEAVVSFLDIENSRDILSALSKKQDVRLAIAELASIVTQAASEGDLVAQTIAEQAAAALAALVRSAVSQLALDADFPLVLAGGVLCNSPGMRKSLLDKLREDGLAPGQIATISEPVEGCLQIARRELQLALPS